MEGRDASLEGRRTCWVGVLQHSEENGACLVNQAIDGVSCDHEARWNSAKKRFTFRCRVICPVHSFANEYLLNAHNAE